MDKEASDDGLTGRVIGAAIEVHKRLGPGFLEYIYERALVIELVKRGISLAQQHEISLSYDGVEIGKHRLDLFVADCLVVELKTVRAIDEAHIATVKSYLRAVGQEVGLLFNFSKSTLEIRRILLKQSRVAAPSYVKQRKQAGYLLAFYDPIIRF